MARVASQNPYADGLGVPRCKSRYSTCRTVSGGARRRASSAPHFVAAGLTSSRRRERGLGAIGAAVFLRSRPQIAAEPDTVHQAKSCLLHRLFHARPADSVLVKDPSVAPLCPASVATLAAGHHGCAHACQAPIWAACSRHVILHGVAWTAWTTAFPITLFSASCRISRACARCLPLAWSLRSLLR
jgi:hypothetical protein